MNPPDFRLTAIAAATLMLSACGGSDTDAPDAIEPIPPVEFAHEQVGTASFAGALVGAQVCADLNFNASCDGGEPSATTDSDGAFTLNWQSSNETEAYQLVAVLPVASAVKQPLRLAMPSPVGASNAPAAGTRTSLLAHSKHSGTINPLTDLEARRMNAAGSDDKAAVEARLGLLLPGIFTVSATSPYQITADDTAKPEFKDALALLDHIEMLIDGQLPQILAAEEVMFVGKSLFTGLADEAGLSVTDWLASDPLNLRYRVSDVLKNLGYISSPIDERLMSEANWSELLDNESDDDGDSHLLSIAQLGDSKVVELRAGAEANGLWLTLINGQLMRTTLDGHELASECWNTELSRWVGEEGAQGYQRPEPIFQDNRLTRVYEGTMVAVETTVDKFRSDDSEFQTLIAALPPELKLGSLDWPNTVYRLNYHQTADVLCRSQGAISYPFTVAAAEINGEAIVAALWPYEFADGLYEIQGDDEFVIKDAMGPGEDIGYRWALDNSVAGKTLVHLKTISGVPEQALSLDEGEYWLVEAGVIGEVDLNKAFNTETLNWLWLSYDPAFTPVIRAHLNGL
ncbi:hypothetical protein MJ923_02120 [Shewanella sp. 3B26]|uniref:Uncharacterized protein n=1 Tax=Shewanella zhuhaiensis TaxID=2919576 RepID=A0AAJ1BE76_9GAMM|nr:hypothetical protein [Shewanella zhuhaiensis]MCH4293101.1 hypothetical protein [Shewanella zhuhaiensis]